MSGVPLRVLAGGGAIAIALGMAAIWFEPYRRARFFSFLDPGHDPQGAGYQTLQGIMGLGSGGIFGTGIGQGVLKNNYLPEAHTDMIFATIGEELGLRRRDAGHRRLRRVRLRGAACRASLPGSVRQAARGRPDDARLRAGADQSRRGARARAADRNHASVRVLRRVEPGCLPRCGRASSLTSQGMGEQRELKCLIAAGGTAGHVLPSLAVAEALVARGVTVTFAGSPDRAEARLVPDAGFELDTFRVSGLPRKPGPAQLASLGRAMRAPRACKRILRERRPDVVLGGGGYVAGPVVYAASRLGIPAALMEADAHLGLANRLAAPFAKRVFLSFPIEGREGAKYQVVGRPIPARNRATSKAEGRRVFDLPPRARVLLVHGGSQGAASLNDIVVESFGAAGPAILHLTGEREYERLKGRVSRDDYELVPFTDEFGAALGAADLVLSRSGGAVWELAAAGKPAILVPYPFATADHQTKNARFFERAGGAITVPETELGRVADLARSLIGDPDRLKEMGEAMTRVARPDAAEEIAEELVALAR